MSRAQSASLFILLVNLVLCVLMYQSVGWHFIRGYNEVANFMVALLAAIQGCLNLLIAAPIVLVNRWRRSRGGRTALASLLLSAAVMLLSPLFAPVIGRVANRNLWIETPMVQAARYGDVSLVKALIANGADPNAKQPSLGLTTLHYIVYAGETETVELLLASGADPNAKAGGLQTPLHWAIRGFVDVSTIELLIKHGANPTLQDSKGRTPGDLTEGIPNPLRADILKAMGCHDLPLEAPASPYRAGFTD